MQSDESLYEAARQGSHTAFAQLYARYESPLFGYVVRRLGSRQDAEEVLQEAMLAVLKGPQARFSGAGFAPWLYRVAHNAALNRVRARRRAVEARGQIWDTEAAPSADAALESQERLRALESAARGLSPPLAQVYALRCAGKSYEEMAADLGLPLGTVKSRLHALVTHLRKELGRWTAR
jgi:RNA polymerase sigma-70 factor (ECF subfamily)